jgi:hypothetical protein
MASWTSDRLEGMIVRIDLNRHIGQQWKMIVY